MGTSAEKRTRVICYGEAETGTRHGTERKPLPEDWSLGRGGARDANRKKKAPPSSADDGTVVHGFGTIPEQLLTCHPVTDDNGMASKPGSLNEARKFFLQFFLRPSRSYGEVRCHTDLFKQCHLFWPRGRSRSGHYSRRLGQHCVWLLWRRE